MGQALVRVSHKKERFRSATLGDACQSKNNLIILPLFNLKMNYRANRIQQVYLLLRCSR